LTGKRSLVGNAYMQQAASLQAYLLYYWPVSYAQTVAALQREPRFFDAVKKIASPGATRPIRILDLGSGPAPACCALADLAQGRGEQNLRFEFCLYDSSGDALSLGKRILENAFPKTGRVETNVCNFENVGKTKTAAAFLGEKKYDFIIASHSLNELWKNEKKRGEKVAAFLSAVCDQLEDGGLLLLTEPALLATSRALIEARDWLVQNGMRVVSPCLCSQAPCPALENPNATCHCQFDWEMPQIVADLARLAGLNRADVKMTYFVFEKSAGDSFGQDSNLWQDQEAAGPDFRLAKDFIQDQESAAPSPSQEPISALVVSEPMLNKAGRIRYVLCDGKSRFTLSAKNGDPLASAQNFFALKRYDKIAIQNAQVRSQKGEPLSLGIGEETRIFLQNS
ncbi:MAG: methyltransferase domain-containing protein, partial [Treponema sp.]|nr:methyltransferase domain-containing protein [Treponema sp.]